MSIRLVDVNYVRTKTFPQARTVILDHIAEEKHLDILISAPQGAGKSVWSDQLAAELAKKGLNILFAVPSGDLAKEHKDRLQSMGITAHLLQSHKATFKGRTLECPDYDNIQYMTNLGVESTEYKGLYCKNCPFYQTCDYPRQYAEAVEPHNNIVIMQHAHFKCTATLMQLFQGKKFDVLIIDESFIDGLIDIIKPTEFEVAALASFGEKWSTRLSTWLRDGGQPGSSIRASSLDLGELQKIFEDNNQGWRMKSLIDAYNSGVYLYPEVGIKQFHSVPYIPIRILTDATPTEEELKLVLNSSNFMTVGKGEVLDIKKYHPENEIIQVLDSTLSKTSLQKDEKFYEFLNFIGDKCSSEFINDKVLITSFKDKEDFPWTQETIDYLLEKYPSLDVGTDPMINRIVVDGMKVGVNTYSSFSIQFLMCSVYMSAGQLAQSVYKTKLAINHWRRKGEQIPIQNILPPPGDISIEVDQIPVRRIEPDGVYEYPDFSLYVPAEKFHRMAYEKNVGKSQQAIRLRFTENIDRRKKVFIFGNYNFPSILVTKTLLLDDVYAELN